MECKQPQTNKGATATNEIMVDSEDRDEDSEMDQTVVEFNVSKTEPVKGDSIDARLEVTPEPRKTVDPSLNPDLYWSLDSDNNFGTQHSCPSLKERAKQP